MSQLRKNERRKGGVRRPLAAAALLARLAARGGQPNLSFFAFTATPKASTLKLFGRFDPDK